MKLIANYSIKIFQPCIDYIYENKISTRPVEKFARREAENKKSGRNNE